MQVDGWKNSRNPQNNQRNGQKAYAETYMITVVPHNLIMYEFILHTCTMIIHT